MCACFFFHGKNSFKKLATKFSLTESFFATNSEVSLPRGKQERLRRCHIYIYEFLFYCKTSKGVWSMILPLCTQLAYYPRLDLGYGQNFSTQLHPSSGNQALTGADDSVMIWAPQSTCCYFDNNGINIGLRLSMQHPRHVMYFSFTAFWWRLSLPWGDILALAYKGPTLISTHTSVGFSITDRFTFCMYKLYSEDSWERERQREKESWERDIERKRVGFFSFPEIVAT